jgi:hypothetical protein
MNLSTTRQAVAMRRTGVRAPRIHRELTLVRRRDDRVPAHGNWSCGCEYFTEHRFCAHTLAMETHARIG